MLRHIVWWTLKDEADGFTADQNAARVKEASASLSAIPSVITVEVSIEVAEATSTVPARVVLQSSHADAEGLRAYAEHPVHLESGKLVRVVCASRQSLDYYI